MKQQFVVTNRYTVLDETEKTCHILNKATVKSVRFLRKYAKLFFFFLCTYTILTGVFVTQLSINAGISV